MSDEGTSKQPSKEPPTLADTIRHAREAAGLSLRQLSPLVGLDYSVLSRIESGKVARPSPEVLQNIADVLEIDAGELLAFIGVKANLPEPKAYFRRAYGMTEDEAAEAEQVIAELRARRQRSPESD